MKIHSMVATVEQRKWKSLKEKKNVYKSERMWNNRVNGISQQPKPKRRSNYENVINRSEYFMVIEWYFRWWPEKRSSGQSCRNLDRKNRKIQSLNLGGGTAMSKFKAVATLVAKAIAAIVIFLIVFYK